MLKYLILLHTKRRQSIEHVQNNSAKRKNTHTFDQKRSFFSLCSLFISLFHSYFMKRNGAQFNGIFILLHKALLVQCANVTTNNLSHKQNKKLERERERDFPIEKNEPFNVPTDCPAFDYELFSIACDFVFPNIIHLNVSINSYNYCECVLVFCLREMVKENLMRSNLSNEKQRISHNCLHTTRL